MFIEVDPVAEPPVLRVVFTTLGDRALLARLSELSVDELDQLRRQLKADVRIAVGLHGA